MSFNHRLIAVQKQFQSWRANKTSPQQAMPEDLKAAALALRQDYSDQEIAKALNINASQFRLWFSRCWRWIISISSLGKLEASLN